jgi:hypothetical protein
MSICSKCERGPCMNGEARCSTGFRIVETDNHGGDYPDEKFVNIPVLASETEAQEIADAINKHLCKNDYANRYWKVVPSDYHLQPGFEP